MLEQVLCIAPPLYPALFLKKVEFSIDISESDNKAPPYHIAVLS